MNEEDVKQLEMKVNSLVDEIKSEFGYYRINSEHALKDELLDVILDYMDR